MISAISTPDLTADYVAFARTTYAKLARPFLPADVKTSYYHYLAQQGDVKLLRAKAMALGQLLR